MTQPNRHIGRVEFFSTLLLSSCHWSMSLVHVCTSYFILFTSIQRTMSNTAKVSTPAPTKNKRKNQQQDETDSANKKRKMKDLPECLAFLTEDNFRNMVKFRLEMDGKETGEIMVAYEVLLEGGDTFDLNMLTLDQLRLFCRNVGVRYASRCNKFQCQKAVWYLSNYQVERERDLSEPISISNKTTNNIIRLCNIIFSHEFLDSFLALNDIKTRVHHETQDLPKDFWGDVADAMNCSDDDDSIALCLILSADDDHFEEIKSLQLQDFDIMTPDAIKKR
jgi:hypothetical protein